MKRKAEGLLLECTHPDHQGSRMMPRGWFARSGGGRRYAHCRDCRRAAKSTAAAVRRTRLRATHALYGQASAPKVMTKDVRMMLRRQGHRCACGCGRLLFEYHIDHIKSLAKGGIHELSNLQLLAPICNLRKGSK